jgi:hypothetical protein
MSEIHSKKLLFITILLFMLCSISSVFAVTGDVDNNGVINIIDALKTAQYYVGLNPPGFDVSAADANADGAITIIDALIIAQYYVGLVPNLPPGGSATMPPPTTSPGGILPTPAPTMSPGTPMGTPAPGSVSSGGPGIAPPVTPPVIIPPDPSGTPDPNIHHFYFSYDDSASTAAVELVKYQINNNQTANPNLARPWEFLNYEEFSPDVTENTGLFDLSMGLWERPALDPDYVTEYKLGVYIASPTINIDTRKNIVITLVIDISGSMGTTTTRVDNTITTRMDIAKYGLNRMAESLKDGDVINIITFDTYARIVEQGLTYENDLQTYLDAIDTLGPTGTTNLADGLDKGYQAALATFDPDKTNRVVMITDAYANTGVIDPAIISNNIVINGQEGIYFSGLGVSADFNEAFLNELVDAGKGAYFTLVNRTDAARAFVDRFYALLTVAAKDVQFRLDFPEGMLIDVTASEETSTDPVDVQPTNFSYNTSQYFFEGFKTESELVFSDQTFKLTITYLDPDDGSLLTEIYEKPVIELLGVDENLIKDAEIIFLFTELFGKRMEVAEFNDILTTYYNTHDSAIFTEYLDLIQLYIGNEFVISPQKIDFGIATVGERLIERVSLSNNTMDDVTVTNVTLNDTSGSSMESVFSHNASVPYILSPLESATFNVVFDAAMEGHFTATLSIETDQQGSTITDILINGSASINPVTPTPTILPPPTIPPFPLPMSGGA